MVVQFLEVLVAIANANRNRRLAFRTRPNLDDVSHTEAAEYTNPELPNLPARSSLRQECLELWRVGLRRTDRCKTVGENFLVHAKAVIRNFDPVCGQRVTHNDLRLM